MHGLSWKTIRFPRTTLFNYIMQLPFFLWRFSLAVVKSNSISLQDQLLAILSLVIHIFVRSQLTNIWSTKTTHHWPMLSLAVIIFHRNSSEFISVRYFCLRIGLLVPDDIPNHLPIQWPCIFLQNGVDCYKAVFSAAKIYELSVDIDIEGHQ